MGACGRNWPITTIFLTKDLMSPFGPKRRWTGAEFAASVENDPEPTHARRRTPDAAIRRLPGQSGIGCAILPLAPTLSPRRSPLNKFLAMPRHEADDSAGATIKSRLNASTRCSPGCRNTPNFRAVLIGGRLQISAPTLSPRGGHLNKFLAMPGTKRIILPVPPLAQKQRAAGLPPRGVTNTDPVTFGSCLPLSWS